MFLTKPLPNEYVLSHLGRIKSINAFPSIEFTVKHLKRHLNLSQHYTTSPKSEFSALASEIEFTDYIQLHTTLPFHQAFDDLYKEGVQFGGINRGHSVGSEDSRPGAYFCQECMVEQIHNNGFSYWKRDHQLPGVSFCLEHNQPLSFASNDQAFEQTPDQINQEEISVVPFLDDLISDPIVICYTESATRLLSFKKPISHYFISYLLEELSCDFEGAVNLKSWEDNFFQSFLYDELPIEWIKFHSDLSILASPKDFYMEFQHVCQRRTITTQLILMALSVVFKSTDQLFSALLGSKLSPHILNITNTGQ